MLSFKTLDVVIGMVFVFLLVSTLCSALRELLEGLLKTRAAYLERGIRELLNDREGKKLVKSLFEHPLLFGLFAGDYDPKPYKERLDVLAVGRGLPSYIPARNFAVALLDIAGRGPQTDEVSADPTSAPLTVQSIRDRILNVENLQVRRALLTALDTSRGDLEVAVKNVEDWFNGSMDRVSGWYRRSTHWVVFWIAVAVVGALRIDTLQLVEHLYYDDRARAALVQQAEAFVDEAEPTKRSEGQEAAGGVEAGAKKVQGAKAAIDELRLPIGWHGFKKPKAAGDWFDLIFGLLITAVAATLGTPFWFDVLNKIMVIRSTVKPREKSPDEGSEDRQPRTPPAPVQLAGAAAMPAAAAPAPVQASTTVFLPRDAESEEDACGPHDRGETRDEDLPAAVGGVG